MRLAYYRVSTSDQSIESQRTALGGNFDKEFSDEGVSGGVMAADRPGFSKLLEQVRPGDQLHVYAIDRLGRDALDVQTMVRRLTDLGVVLHIHGIGVIAGEIAPLVLAVLAQLAELEKRRIRDRIAAGRRTAQESLRTTGRTHKGKASLGRPKSLDGASVRLWRASNKASISQTAAHFRVSVATAKRYLREPS